MRNEILSAPYGSEIAEHWEQAEKVRLGRVKQQKQRMGEMINIIEQYSRVIRDLELKNKFLATQNQKLKSQNTGTSVQKDIEFQNLQRSYLKICEELERERKTRYDYENTIEALRKQLSSPQLATQSSYSVVKKNQTDLNYEVLLTLYQDLKDQVFLLEKENLTLRQVIKEQSKASYTKEAFWKENPIEKNLYKHSKREKENRPGVIRTSSHASIKEQYSKQESRVKITTDGKKQGQDRKQRDKTLYETNSKRSRIRDLETEIKKQAELIQKYRESEGQQIKLIDLLKSQKTKVCACHSQASSKKLVSSKGAIVSFKKDSIAEAS